MYIISALTRGGALGVEGERGEGTRAHWCLLRARILYRSLGATLSPRVEKRVIIKLFILLVKQFTHLSVLYME